MNWLIKQGDETCMYGFCLLVFVYRIIETEPYESGFIEMKCKRKRHQQNLSIAEFIAMNSYRHASPPEPYESGMIEMKHKRKRHHQNLSIAESNP